MCLKESRWRRFTADSVTEITIVQSGILICSTFFEKLSMNNCTLSEAWIILWAASAASFTHCYRLAW